MKFELLFVLMQIAMSDAQIYNALYSLASSVQKWLKRKLRSRM